MAKRTHLRVPSWGVATCLLLLATWSETSAQAPVEVIGTATVSYASGGSVKISRGMGGVSARSSLELEWFMVNDSTLDIIFSEPVGAKGDEDDGWYSYEVDMKMLAIRPVKAFEVRVITFNVWGEFTGTLSFTQLEDLSAGQKKGFKRTWGLLSESSLRPHRTSITYVAKVMLYDGTVIVADPMPALTLAQRIQEDVTLQDLDPVTEPGRLRISQ